MKSCIGTWESGSRQQDLQIDMEELQSAIEGVQGTVGFAAKHLETGQQLSHNADSIFFTAGTLKVPLLTELYRQVDEGYINLSERIELSDDLRVPRSGIFKELATGLQPTVRDAAMLMIIISYDTATDALMEMVGRESLHDTRQTWGLLQTRIPMSVRQLLYSAVDLDRRTQITPLHCVQTVSSRAGSISVQMRTTRPNLTCPLPLICPDSWSCSSQEISFHQNLLRMPWIFSSANNSGPSFHTHCRLALRLPTKPGSILVFVLTQASYPDPTGHTQLPLWQKTLQQVIV